jgi:hypothetical protein
MMPVEEPAAGERSPGREFHGEGADQAEQRAMAWLVVLGAALVSAAVT